MILCLGTTPTAQRSLTFEHFHLNEVNRAAACSEYASGKSINVARVLYTLGKPCLATGFLGGPRGQAIRAELSGSSIPHDFVDVPSAPTRLCTTVIDLSTHTATELVEESAPVPPLAWPALDAKVAEFAPRTRVAVLSGSLPPGGDLDAFARWTGMLRAAGATVILDTRGEPSRRAISCASCAGLVLKMNLQELAESTQTALTRMENARPSMLRMLPKDGILIITLGKEGAIATDGTAFHRVTPPAITPVSAIGSGDAFAAGLAAALYDHWSLSEALKLASACGTANALTDRAGWVDPGVLPQVLAGTVVSAG